MFAAVLPRVSKRAIVVNCCRILLFAGLAAFGLNYSAALAATGQHFQRLFIVVLENTSYSDALRQPYLNELAARGALLQNLQAETHPSQGNYIALFSGSTRRAK